MNFKSNKDTMGLIGKKQCGKSTIIKSIIKNIPKENIIILDSNLEYQGYNRVVPQAYNQEILDDFIRLARKNVNKLIILEDVDLYIGSNPSDELKKLLINGSHQNLGVIYTAKRSLGIPKILLGETLHLIVGNFFIPNDVVYLSSMFKDVEKIKTLKRFEFLYRDEDGEERIIVSNP